MTVNYSVSDTSNYELVGIGSINPLTEFPSIYGNLDFGYTVTFTNTGGPVTGVDYTSVPPYISIQLIQPNQVRITRKTAVPVFTDEEYDFSRFDSNFNKTIETYLPGEVDSADSETSVVAWQVPPVRQITGSYTFLVQYTNINTSLPDSEFATFSQTFVWSQFPGLTILEDLVDRSRY